MTFEKKRTLTLVSNTGNENITQENINTEAQERIKQRENVTQPDVSYHTNPMYEKLLKFRETQKKKRFTVEDLLKW